MIREKISLNGKTASDLGIKEETFNALWNLEFYGIYKGDSSKCFTIGTHEIQLCECDSGHSWSVGTALRNHFAYFDFKDFDNMLEVIYFTEEQFKDWEEFNKE